MENRLFQILKDRSSFLNDNETLLYIKDGEVIGLWNDGEALNEVHCEVKPSLKKFLDWLYDENEY